MAFEYNDFDNAPRAISVRNAVESENGVFTIWMTRSFTAAQAREAVMETGCSGFIAEAEIPAEDSPGVPKPEAQNWVELVAMLHDIPIHKAVATNFAPFTYHDGSPYPEKAKVLVNNGWRCLTEAYDMDGDPKRWIEERAFFASHLGWNRPQPILGIYGGRTFADYPNYASYPNWSVWDASIL